MPRTAEHAADRCDAVGGVEKQRALDRRVRRGAARHVSMHFRKTRHQELALRVDANGSGGNLRLGPRSIDTILPSWTITV